MMKVLQEMIGIDMKEMVKGDQGQGAEAHEVGAQGIEAQEMIGAEGVVKGMEEG